MSKKDRNCNFQLHYVMSRSTVDEEKMVKDLETRLKKRYGEDVWSKMQKETPEMTSTS